MDSLLLNTLNHKEPVMSRFYTQLRHIAADINRASLRMVDLRVDPGTRRARGPLGR